jgi:hypothetical protein
MAFLYKVFFKFLHGHITVNRSRPPIFLNGYLTPYATTPNPMSFSPRANAQTILIHSPCSGQGDALEGILDVRLYCAFPLPTPKKLVSPLFIHLIC